MKRYKVKIKPNTENKRRWYYNFISDESDKTGQILTVYESQNPNFKDSFDTKKDGGSFYISKDDCEILEEDFTRSSIDELIQYLQGTCNSLDEGVNTILGEDYDSMSLSEDNHNQIANEIFLCDTCSWWYEACEIYESPESGAEDTCQDCGECSEEDEDSYDSSKRE